LMRCDHVGKG